MPDLTATRLSDVAIGADNNLNLLRMLAAVAVIVSHAWAVVGGAGALQPLEATVGWQLGTMAVFVFFGISGFLISASFERRVSLDAWIVARILRIFPALAVTLVLTALVLGPLVTALPPGAYFGADETRRYVLNNLSLWFRQDSLPGVFEDLPHAGHINVSHWTLLHEVLCYLGVMVLGLAGVLTGRLRATVFLGIAIAGLAVQTVLIGATGSAVLDGFLFLALPFVIGMGFHVWRDRLILSVPVLLVMVLVAWATHGLPGNLQWVILTLIYGAFVVGYLPTGPIRSYNRLGDVSYGLYIYGFAVQQTVLHLTGIADPWLNLAVALPATLVLATLSWIFVERPAIALGKAYRRRRRAASQLRDRAAFPAAGRR